MKPPSKLALGIASLALVAAACTASVQGRTPPAGKAVASAARPARKPPAPPTTEANITRLTTTILERSQFAHHPLDAELAGRFLDGYFDALDASRSLFLQSDVQEFSAYRKSLAQATRETGDTSAARAIVKRYRERLSQQTALATQLLQAGQFDFSGHEAFSLDREHAERPLDLAAAQELWRQQVRAEYLQEKLSDSAPEKIAGTLTRRYAERLATMQALDDGEVLEIYLNALAHVYDPHSDYLGHEEMESLNISMNLALFGIGASLESKDGYCEIRGLVPGGPAARSGDLKPGDRIIGVAQEGKPAVEIKNLPLTRTVELIRGPKGTPVTLTILPEGAPEGSVPKIVPLVRDEIKLEDEQASARILDVHGPKNKKVRLGVVDLPSFYADMGDSHGSEHRSVTRDVALLLVKLRAEKVQGIVLDLRRNGGGSLNEAITLTGLFIHQGPVVQTRDPSGAVEVGVDRNPSALWEGPLVVLTSRFSASASEILTGALQDYGRALVVGDSSTFGKGTVQSVLPLGKIMDEAGLSHSYDPGALKVTIQKFYRPDGASTQLRGVVSDIVLPSTSDFSDVSESAMKNPLPFDTLPPTPHERLNLVEPYLASLRKASSARIASDKSFAYLADDIARLQKDLASKSVSLNEADRRAEIEQTKARRAEREQASKALRASAPESYAITLKNAALPGLPPPTPPPASDAQTGPAAAKNHAPAGRKSQLGSADDIILNEAVKILGDYVALVPPLD